MSATSRRFPPPWSVDETDACFIIRDGNRQAVAYVYCEDDPGRRSSANLLTRDEARRIAANIAKLPDLPKSKLERPPRGGPRSFTRRMLCSLDRCSDCILFSAPPAEQATAREDQAG